MDGISQFRLIREGNGKNKFRYDYKCKPNDMATAIEWKTTQMDEDGGGNIVYLDRHNIDCGKTAISSFNLQRDPYDGTKLQYMYSCNDVDVKANTCRDVSTPANDDGGGINIYLDKHNLDCGKDEVMTNFRFIREGATKFKYKYKCCKP
jgi:hypothetical protein